MPTGGGALDHVGRASIQSMSEVVVPRGRPLHALERAATLVPPRSRLPALTALGVGGAVLVGYLASENPAAAPAHAAVLVRVAIVVTFIAAGLYAHTSYTQRRMGALLAAAGLYCVVWLLNGSAARFPFSLGVLFSGFGVPMLALVILAHPSGRLESLTERRFVTVLGAGVAVFWVLLILTGAQPPFHTPLVRCGPRCPRNVFFVGARSALLGDVLRALTWVSWAALTCGAPVLLLRRMKSASAPVRRSLAPVAVVATANAVLWLAFFAARTAGLGAASALGAAYVEVVIAVPLAILLGLAFERLFMGRELARFINDLVQTPRSDPQMLMARALDDPSLEIAYPRRGRRNYVDASGSPVVVPVGDPHRSVVWIERDRYPVAAVIYDAELSSQERFVQAAGGAALMRLEGVQLEADLIASTRELAASRARLIDAANEERQRLERDLHDGVQQQLVGLRLKLEMAGELLKEEPRRGQEMVASIGRQMDDLLESLRSLARGIYPALLVEHGVEEALRSGARGSPVPISVQARGIGRYRRDVEVAVYFCCLEAIQNIAKHAGKGAQGMLRIWEDGQRLCFSVSDSGSGFDAGLANAGKGLVNMRDRLEAVGGTLTVDAAEGRGTSITGWAPITDSGP